MAKIDNKIYSEVRRLEREGFSQRSCAIKLGISRNTVRRYWSGMNYPGQPSAYPDRAESETRDLVMARIVDYLENEKHAFTRKQKVTARLLYKHISETVDVSESTVQRCYRALKDVRPDIFIPLSYEPGEVMEVDWCDAKFSIKGKTLVFPVFCAVMMYSYDIFVQVMPDMTYENFFEGHVNAFTQMRGVPHNIWYDNLRTAVKESFGRNAKKQARFALFEAHYGFKADFMNRSAGFEKGGVENLAKIAEMMLSPIPRVDSLAEAQTILVAKCAEYREKHTVRGRQQSVLEMSEEERLNLLPLPLKELRGYEEKQARPNHSLLITYKTNSYSVPYELADKTVALRAYPYRIEIWHAGEIAAVHDRSILKNEKIFDIEHYLSVLDKKPRSWKNAAPARQGKLPKDLATFREKCSAPDKTEQLIKVIMLFRNSNIDHAILRSALENANNSHEPTYELVVQYLKYLLAPEIDLSRGDSNEGPDAVNGYKYSPMSLDEYDKALGLNFDEENENGDDEDENA